jgi:hypothetical protein
MNGKTIIHVSRERIMKLAGLKNKHSGKQNKDLLEKLERLKKAGIILEYPKKITDMIRLVVPPAGNKPPKSGEKRGCSQLSSD